MGLRVIGLDVSDAQLESAKGLGADGTFNVRTHPGYAEKIKTLTQGGAHAVVVMSAARAAYESAPTVLRWVLTAKSTPDCSRVNVCSG